MSERKIDLRALFNDTKRNVLNDSASTHSEEEVRRLYSRMTCIRFMRPLLNYASSFALLHDRKYDEKFIDLLLFKTDLLESNGKNAFDPINTSLNLGYCVVKELAIATPDVTPTLLQGVFRSSFPHFSNTIRACLEAYNYQKAKPELLVAVFRDVYRGILDNPECAKIVNLIDGDFAVVNDSKASLVCTELNMLFKLGIVHNFPGAVYVGENTTKEEAFASVVHDTVQTVELWVKQISDDSSRKGLLASEAGVKLVQNLMNTTSDIMCDEFVYQVSLAGSQRLSGGRDSKFGVAGRTDHIALARNGFVQRVGIYAEKTESIAYAFDRYLNMVGSVLYQQVHSSSGSMRSALNLQMNNSSLTKVVKLICSSIDNSMLRLKDYLEEVRLSPGVAGSDFEFASSRHYRSSGDLTADILDDYQIAVNLTENYVSQLIAKFSLPEDYKERHWFSSEIFQALYGAVASFRRKSEDISGLLNHLNAARDFIVSDVEEFIKKHRIDWVASSSGYNPNLKANILAAIICSSVKAVARNSKIIELTYIVKPYQLRDVVKFSLNQAKLFFDTHKIGMLAGISNEGAIMVFQNIMNNVSNFYTQAVHSAIANVAQDPESSKADFMYNYHNSEVDVPVLLNEILQHAAAAHDAVNVMRLTHLVAPAKKTDVVARTEDVSATSTSVPQFNNSIKVRTLR